jgi:hypothetical protein
MFMVVVVVVVVVYFVIGSVWKLLNTPQYHIVRIIFMRRATAEPRNEQRRIKTHSQENRHEK